MSNNRFLFIFFLCILPLNMLIDFLNYFEKFDSLATSFRIIFNTTFIFYFCFSNKFQWVFRFRILFFLIIYWFVLVFFSLDPSYSIVEYMKVSSSLLFFPIGYFLINNKRKFYLFMKVNFYSLFLHVILVSLINYFDFGTNFIKGNDVSTSFSLALADSRLFYPSFMLALIPFGLSNSIIRNRLFWILLAMVNLVLLVFSVKRTTILIVSCYTIISNFFSKKKIQLLYITIVISGFTFLFYPWIESNFLERLQSRKYFVTGDYEFEEEGRLIELSGVFGTFLKTDRFSSYLFGINSFDSINQYGALLRDRPIHNDFLYVLFSSGIIGLILYLFFIFKIYFLFTSILYNNDSIFYKNLNSAFVALFIVFLLVSFIGNMWAITYKIFAFSFFGSFISVKDICIKYDKE